MSLPIPDAERRSAQVIYPEAFKGWGPAEAIPGRQRLAQMRTTLEGLGYSVEQPTPIARAIAAIETGVLTEELLFGGIVLRLPPPRSPLRALVRQLASRLAR